MHLHVTQMGGWPFPRVRPGHTHTVWRQRTAVRSLAGIVLFAVLVALTPAAPAFQEAAHSIPPQAAPVSPAETRAPRENSYVKRKWGVEPMFVRQTAAGYMLEFRYRVLDAEKAKPLFERRTKPILTLVETGAQLIVPTPPTTGALRNSNTPLPGHIYWMFFANPGRLVKPGQHVNVTIGEFHVDGLVVQ